MLTIDKTPTPKTKSTSPAEQSAQQPRIPMTIQKIVDFQTPLGYVEQACDLVQEAPTRLVQLHPNATVYSKKLRKKVAKLNGFFSVPNFLSDVLKLDSKLLRESPQKAAKLILSIFKNFTKSLNWSESMGMLSLSERISSHLKVLTLLSNLMGSYIQIIENFKNSSSFKKHLKADFKALNATLKACQYFFQIKALKMYLKPITSVTDLANDSFELYENIQKIMKGKYKGKEISLKMCQSLTSIGLSVIFLITFAYGEAFAFPALAFLLSSMNFGSDVALYAMS